MTNHLSPAQILHVDVLRSILKWVVNEQRSHLLVNCSQLGNLKELLTLSSTWRQAALECLWRELTLSIDTPTNEVHLERPVWVKQKSLPYNVENLAKEIRVSAPMSGIASGMAQKLLVDYLGDTQCFPLVYKLTISVIDYYGQYTDSKCNSIPNTLEFAKLLKSMAPAATTIEIACQEFSTQEVNTIDNFGPNSKDDILKALATVLYASTKRANLYMYKAGIEKLSTIDDIPPLSSINFGYSFSQPAHKVLVRKSASTLQYLDIDISNANMILYGTDGEAVVYPNLQHLQLRWCAKHDTDPMVVTAETVLFPVLRTLQLGSHYPFNNDVLFRGNAATLEYLQITLDRGDVSMFNRCKTFENKHKVLRHVIINEDFGDTLFVSQADEI
ncbi:hypothetical protein GGF41_001542, partial [Coemansia sp. RSA 2531]